MSVGFGTAVTSITMADAEALMPLLPDADKPMLLKGLVKDWPLVQAAKQSDDAALSYLASFDSNVPITAYLGGPDIDGRIFYNDDFSGFNFERAQLPLKQLLSQLLAAKNAPKPPTIYMGSTLVDHWLPGFRQENDLPINLTASEQGNTLVSVWIGNQSRIAAHYDFPQNIACCAVGKRRFILFPPEQIENLYVGPLEITPSGQPISLVDMQNPDLTRFPRFAKAMESALVAELEPGDALFIPSMWWHQVQSLSACNVLVNYWWRNSPAILGAPINVLTHALLSLKSLPKAQRDSWRNLLDYYVFEHEQQDFAHIPKDKQGALGPINEQMARQLRAQLLNKLNR
ncbi:cupin-like domain-containing protein [Aliiglaciecola sp. CAU 1673]|uniref:cupin-like domain-containing protein n=1 Tax=Aliiglaciecola sp. CAU 1673 TaxID=3032595 RepID=UPI0023DB0418|nr:cupin-like domain-containing protein [Aliiglaciecola sp. CAU 1673]MDF2178787.1 cupin-like domain-containing protein [Aliiglaciecola sp. CAU 1673]